MTEQTSQNAKKEAMATFRAGSISVSLWENTAKNSKGQEFKTVTAQLQRSYKDKNDKWVNEKINLRRNDIANVRLVLNKAFEKMALSNDEEESEE